MCGIVGYITKTDKIYAKEKAHFMRFALPLDTLRGYDSTGIMTIKGRGFKVDIQKDILPGDAFVKTKVYRENWSAGWVKIGHNRAATAGEVTKDNAHPFTIGPITLVHNGTLWGGGHSMEHYNKELDVDSMQIAWALGQVQPSAAHKIIEDIDGSYALVWFDERDRSVNMTRNAERPLHYSLNQPRDALFFMSDGYHLHSILKSMQGSSAVSRTIYQLDRDFLLKWKKGSLVPEVTKISPFVSPVFPISRQYVKNENENVGQGKTALEKAAGVWQKQLAMNGSTTNIDAAGTEERPKVLIGGKLRVVPWPHIDTLKTEYDLDTDDFLRFTPEQTVRLDRFHDMVIGKIYHPAWGDCEWNAVLYDAKHVQTGAYMNYDWLVRPIGIGHSWDVKNEAPSVLCSLMHCDWRLYKDALNKTNQKRLGAPDSGKVPTGDGSLFYVQNSTVPLTYKDVLPMLQSGCISCATDLTLDELPHCETANDGVDLLCPSCVKDFRENNMNHTH